MKKFLILLLVILVVVPCFANTYTEEEFYEVYDALKETTTLLEEANSTISSLQEQIAVLKENSEKLTAKLDFTQGKLDYLSSVLKETKQELSDSNDIITKLLNQKFITTAGIVMSFDPGFGFKLGLGYKVWLGYLVGEFSWFNERNPVIGISYSIVF